MKFRVLFAAFSIFILAGCNNEAAKIPDNELADNIYACRTAVDQSPGFAIRCDNYKRECERRREEGRYVC